VQLAANREQRQLFYRWQYNAARVSREVVFDWLQDEIERRP